MRTPIMLLATLLLAACDAGPAPAEVPLEHEGSIPEFTLPVDPGPVDPPVAADPVATEAPAIAPQPEPKVPVAAAPLPEPVVAPEPVAEPDPPALAEAPAPAPPALTPLDPEAEYQAWLADRYPHLAGKPLSTVTTPTAWTFDMVRAGHAPCHCTPAAWANRAAVGDFELQWTAQKGISSGQASLSIPMIFTAEVMMTIGQDDPHNPDIIAALIYSAIYKPERFKAIVAATRAPDWQGRVGALVQ